jgi:hypothetical protein
MIQPRQLIGAACAAAAILPALAQQQQQGPLQQVEVRRHLPVSQACPDVYQALPAMLQKAAQEIEDPAELMVEFNLDGNRVSGVHTQGNHWAYGAPVRRAVKRLDCHSPDAGAYAVRFRVVFQFSDDAAGTTAMLPPDFAPAMVRR